MRLNGEPAFPKCRDFWVPQWRQVLLGTVTNWTPKTFQSLWEMLLTGHAVLGWKERRLKPFGDFPGLPMQGQISFFHQEIYFASTRPFGKRKKSHFAVLGGKSLVPPLVIPLLAEVSPPRLLTTQGRVPRRRGLVPSQSCQAQCKGEAAGCRSRCLEDALMPAAAERW